MVFSNRPGPFVARMENWNRRCPASTIFADSCCLIEKCYRKISTEKSAPGVTRHQRHFRYSTGIRQRCSGRGVDQLVGHDASPPLHPPLQRTRVRSAETIRGRLLQPAQQYHRAGVRIFLQPPQHVAPHTFEGIGPRSPGVRRSRPRFSCDLLMFLTPAVGQPGQKAFQALAPRRGPEFRGHERRPAPTGLP